MNKFVTLVLFWFLLFAGNVFGQTLQYDFVDLFPGSTTDPESGIAYEISNTNKATGGMEISLEDCAAGVSDCLVMSAVRWSESEGALSLGFLNGASACCQQAQPCMGYDINNQNFGIGEVVGEGQLLSTQEFMASFNLGDPHTFYEQLEYIGGPDAESRAFGVNESFEVSGWLVNEYGDDQAWWYDPVENETNLIPLGSYDESYGLDISQAGDVVGYALNGTTKIAFVYDVSGSNYVVLPTASPMSAVAKSISINDLWISGYVESGGEKLALRWKFNGSTWTTKVLPVGLYTSSEANDVSSQGWVVGYVVSTANGMQGFVYDETNDNFYIVDDILTNEPSGFKVKVVYGINDSQWICGMGKVSGESNKGFIAKPIFGEE